MQDEDQDDKLAGQRYGERKSDMPSGRAGRAVAMKPIPGEVGREDADPARDSRQPDGRLCGWPTDRIRRKRGDGQQEEEVHSRARRTEHIPTTCRGRAVQYRLRSCPGLNWRISMVTKAELDSRRARASGLAGGGVSGRPRG